MHGPVERAHQGLLLQALYPLGGKVPGLARVPRPLRRAARRGLTRAGVRAHLARCRDVRIAAITGSTGKTTSKDLLALMLADAGPTLKTRQNDNNLYGVPATLLSIRPSDRFAVIEVGIRDAPGEMSWMAGLFRPEVVILTRIAEDHTSIYGSREAVAREKRALLERLGPEGVAVVNADDPLTLATAQGLPCRVVTAGHAADADMRLVEARSAWPEGYELRLQCDGEDVSATIGLHGEHLAPLVALTLAAAHALGVEPEAALAAAARGFVMPKGRLRPERGPTGSTFLMDDYKSRPSCATAALRALGDSTARRRIAVLGEVDENPDRESNYRDSANLLPGCADLVFAIGRAAPHFRKLLAGTELAGGGLRPFDGFADAAEALREEVAEGDVVLIHGSTSQHLGRIKLLLDGRRVGCQVRRCSLRWLCTDCPHLDGHPPEGVVLAGPS